jgi:nucleotide-binding universal stress UspA family protein
LTFNRILVPFDNSELSYKAVDQALELATEELTQIFILYVINEIPLPIHLSKIEQKNDNVVISPLVNQVYNEVKHDMIPILDNIKQGNNKYNIVIATEIRIGDPAEVIVDFAKQEKIDLIVMGSIGHKGFAGMFRKLGSVARKVAEEVTSPVFIVR